MQATRTAWVAGATGLVGKFIVEQLQRSQEYSAVHLLVRRSGAIALGAKAHEKIVADFSVLTPQSLADMSPVDDVYCALGTTIKKAGSQAAFSKVDFEAVVNLAKAAKASGAKTFAVVSSVGATTQTSNFYLRTKGEMEGAITEVGFDRLIIARPSLLLGNRQEKRLGEQIGSILGKLLAPLMIGEQRSTVRFMPPTSRLEW